MYYHVVRNDKREGKSVYVLQKTYQRREAMEKWVEKQGLPVWVVESDRDCLVTWGAFGHDSAEYWNSGAGWQRGWMPPLEIY